MDARAAVGIAAVVGAFLLSGCGGNAFVFTGDGGAGGDDSGDRVDAGGEGGSGVDAGHDGGTRADAGGDAGGQGACPGALPSAGGACSPTGLECEYGTSPVRSCNTIATCNAGRWAITDKTACPVGTCPPTYTSAMSAVCTSSGLVCSYAEGTCGCSFGGGPIQVIDGAVVSRWQCQPAQAGCPSPRPDIGTPCPTPGTACSYAPCSGGVYLTCMDGRWDDTPVACPASAATSQ